MGQALWSRSQEYSNVKQNLVLEDLIFSEEGLQSSFIYSVYNKDK